MWKGSVLVCEWCTVLLYLILMGLGLAMSD